MERIKDYVSKNSTMIIIILIIYCLFLTYYVFNKKINIEGMTAASTIDPEAVKNMASIMAGVNGKTTLNDLDITGTLTVNGLATFKKPVISKTTLNDLDITGALTVNGLATFKNGDPGIKIEAKTSNGIGIIDFYNKNNVRAANIGLHADNRVVFQSMVPTANRSIILYTDGGTGATANGNVHMTGDAVVTKKINAGGVIKSTSEVQGSLFRTAGGVFTGAVNAGSLHSRGGITAPGNIMNSRMIKHKLNN